MTSKQELFRQRVVSFYKTYENEGLLFTVRHFKAEGRSERTIRYIIKTYKERNTTERKVGTGKQRKCMTEEKVRELYKLMNHKDGLNYSSAARKFGCHRKTIRYWLMKRQIKKYKKKKCPKYTQTQEELVRRQCAWMYRKFRKLDFVIDDEKYFTLSHSLNDSFFSSPTKTKTPLNVSHNPKAKYEPKVMLWIAISKHGISEPYIRANGSGFSVNQNIYMNECIKKRLMPFIREHHNDDKYIFWPDKASSHYAKQVVDYLKLNKVKYIPKYRNPTNVPQCRPIEDFFGILVKLVYADGWRASTTKQLIRRIRLSLKKLDLDMVQRTVESVSRRLRKCGQRGPMAVVH